MDAKDALDVIKDGITDPGIRAMILGRHVENTLHIVYISPEEAFRRGLFVIQVLHAAYRHPEWMMGVVQDTMGILRIDEKLYEGAIEEIMNFYRLTPMEVGDTRRD